MAHGIRPFAYGVLVCLFTAASLLTAHAQIQGPITESTVWAPGAQVATPSSTPQVIEPYVKRTLAWRPDGRKIATGSQDGTVEIWDVNTRQTTQTLRQAGFGPALTGPVTKVVWKPGDSRTLASAGLDQHIVIFDVPTGRSCLFIGQLPFTYTSITWSPDGSKIAGVNDGGVFQIWNALTGQLLTTIPSPPADFSYDVTWSPDGRKIATAGSDRIKIWTSNGQYLSTLQDNGPEVTSLAWSADSSKIASADVKGIVRIWNVASHQIIQTFSGHTDIAFSVAWSPDETQLVTTSADRTVRIWDVETGQAIQTVLCNDRVFDAVWSPDGKRIAYGNPNGTVSIIAAPRLPTSTPKPINKPTAIPADLRSWF